MRNTFEQLLEELSETIGTNSTALCLGTFDGVHLGHKSLFNKLIEKSNQNNQKSIVFVFERRPRELIDPNSYRPYILPLKDRIEKIKSIGIYKTITIQFDSDLQKLTAEQFLEKLKKTINLKTLIVSHNTRIGNDQLSTKSLEEACTKLNISLISVHMSAEGNSIVSSSYISSLIHEGEVHKANKLLGENFYFLGLVEEGDKIGRTIGFPTANLKVSKDIQIPSDGVYASKVKIDNKIYSGALSIGDRPIITNDNSRKIEIYILDFDEEIYNKTLSVSIVRKIRNQQNYDSLDKLKDQIKKDIIELRKIINNE